MPARSSSSYDRAGSFADDRRGVAPPTSAARRFRPPKSAAPHLRWRLEAALFGADVPTAAFRLATAATVSAATAAAVTTTAAATAAAAVSTTATVTTATGSGPILGGVDAERASGQFISVEALD